MLFVCPLATRVHSAAMHRYTHPLLQRKLRRKPLPDQQVRIGESSIGCLTARLLAERMERYVAGHVVAEKLSDLTPCGRLAELSGTTQVWSGSRSAGTGTSFSSAKAASDLAVIIGNHPSARRDGRPGKTDEEDPQTVLGGNG